jgi:ribosomal-protein-alanine N-acetyltransferase
VGEVRIRTGNIDDIEAILRVQRGAVEAPEWGEAVWRTLTMETPHEGNLRCVLVAEIDGAVAGFAALGGVGDIAEIESVVVDVSVRGQGIGTALCREIMRWAGEHGAVAMELEVRESNVAARRMYARLGFVEQGSRKGYYRAPAEDAVLMAVPLTMR